VYAVADTEKKISGWRTIKIRLKYQT